jgi:hypothetical protein
VKINRKLLLEALSRAGAACATRTTLPVLSCVKMFATENFLTIEANNLNSRIVRHVDCDGGLETVVVKHSVLTVLLSNFEGDAIELSNVNGKLQLKDGNRIRSVASLPVDDFPVAPTNEGELLAVNLNDLADGLEAVSWCAEKNNSAKVWRTCVTVELTDQKLSCFAGAGSYAALFERASICSPKTFLIPADMVRLLSESLRESDEVRLSERSLNVSGKMGSCSVKFPEAQALQFRGITDLSLGHKGTPIPVSLIRRSCRDAVVQSALGKVAAIEMIRKDDTVDIFLKNTEDGGHDTIITPGEPLDFQLPAAQVENSLSNVSSETASVITLPNAVFMQCGEVLLGFAQMLRN